MSGFLITNTAMLRAPAHKKGSAGKRFSRRCQKSKILPQADEAPGFLQIPKRLSGINKGDWKIRKPFLQPLFHILHAKFFAALMA